MNKKDHSKIAASLLLRERLYTSDEISYGMSFFKDGIACTKSSIVFLADNAESMVKLERDSHHVGTSFYQGLAYFWAYKYRFWMRGDAHGNGYKGTPIKKARKLIHKRFLDEGLDVDGKTQRHDEIINEVFGMKQYRQEE